MSQSAARKCFSEANMSPRDVDVIELHDCFAPNEVSSILVSIMYKTATLQNTHPRRLHYGAVLTMKLSRSFISLSIQKHCFAKQLKPTGI